MCICLNRTPSRFLLAPLPLYLFLSWPLILLLFLPPSHYFSTESGLNVDIMIEGGQNQHLQMTKHTVGVVVFTNQESTLSYDCMLFTVGAVDCHL